MVLCLPNCTRDDFMVASGLNWIYLHFSPQFNDWLCSILAGLTNLKWCQFCDLVVKLQMFTTCPWTSLCLNSWPRILCSVLYRAKSSEVWSSCLSSMKWFLERFMQAFVVFKLWDHYHWYSQAETDVHLSEDVTERSTALVEV